MNTFIDYNISKYVDSIIEVKKMVLDGILNSYNKCKKYPLAEGVSDYLYYIEDEPFYIPPTFNDVKTDIRLSTLKPKFILFSAPGATGKSSLAKHIANRFDGIYWDLAKLKIGTNSFSGSILNAVGAAKYSEFIGDLNAGNVLLVIDAFDEAEIVSGRKMLSTFITDISNNLSNHQAATVFLLARTETAQYIASFCAENHIPVSHYEIGFFNEIAAKEFILKSFIGKNTPTAADSECADSYYDLIKRNIADEESTSFLGYAPVLEAIAKHIIEFPNRQKLISLLSTQRDCISIISKIMDDLLEREQEKKVVPAFVEKCKEAHPEFSDWDKVYSTEEQLVRIINYVLFNDTSYGNYTLSFLPPQLVDDYQALLDRFLIQHPFVRNSAETGLGGRNIDFTGPAFRDYALTKVILNDSFEPLAHLYFEESSSQSFFPSQIFFDSYMKISENTIHPNHISYIYDSFKAKTTAYERPYLQCSEITSSEDEKCIAVFGMVSGKQQTPKRDDYFAKICPADEQLHFGQLINVSIDTPNMDVCVGRQGVDARIYNSSIICKKLFWSTKNISIESYDEEECLIVAKEGFSGDSVSIEISRSDNLKISAPNVNSYYRLVPFKYDFEDPTEFDIVKFIHALRCILVEFRTHGKDTLAKTADRIDNVTVGNSVIKSQVLAYLKHCNIIYESAHLYKIDEVKMQDKGINFNALSRMNSQQLKDAFADFCRWAQDNN